MTCCAVLSGVPTSRAAALRGLLLFLSGASWLGSLAVTCKHGRHEPLPAPPAGDPRGSMHPMERQGVVLEATLAGRQPFMSLWPLRTRREHLRREHRRPLWAVVTQQFADRERAADREQASGDRPDLQERRGRTISRTTSKSIPLMISTSRCFEIGLRSNSIVPRSMDLKPWPSPIEKRPLDALCC